MGCPVHCGTVISIPVLHSPGASGTIFLSISPPHSPLPLAVITKNVSKHCQISPKGQDLPWLKSLLYAKMRTFSEEKEKTHSEDDGLSPGF